ncbi:hypothetical protein VTK26DRAFT_5730 [Humicola hyalothermophila]
MQSLSATTPSSSSKLSLRRAATANSKSSFSTSPIPRSNAANNTHGANPAVTYQAPFLKRISPNPRVRAGLVVGLVAMTACEGYMLTKYWPTLFGGDGKERKQ